MIAKKNKHQVEATSGRQKNKHQNVEATSGRQTTTNITREELINDK